MTTLYLFRHGQASFGQQNYDQLSDLGIQQAQRLGQSLGSRLPGFDKIVLGSMLRHRQTAQHCLANMPNQQIPDDSAWHQNADWNEYDHQDILAQLGDEFDTPQGIERYVRAQPNPKQAFETLFNDAMARWMGGKHDSDYVESWQHYQQRVRQALETTLAMAQKGERVAVFSSGGPISVVSQHLLGVPADNIMRLNWTLVNCGITKLVATGQRVFVASLNEHSHFEGDYHAMITYK